ncbi:MAG: nickel-type superoxide dismutase maturation protease [Cyanobacteria bacterium J06626_23]
MARLLPRSNWRELLRLLMRKRQRYQVAETSMLPTLKPGDTVLVQPLAPSTVIASCDIVVARHPSHPNLLLIKRVKEIFYDGGCYLISDNLAEPTAQDSRSFGVVAADQIIGRVTSLFVSAP